MGEKMSLQEAIEHAQHYTRLGGGRIVHIKREAWDTIIAHLTQPAQAVAVGAINAVIRELRKWPKEETFYDHRATRLACADKLTAALPNANGKEG